MQLKVLSWNIWCYGYLDRVAEFLKTTDADVICLQEVVEDETPNISDYLTKELEYNHVYAKTKVGVTKNDKTTYIGNATYTKFKILKTTTHLLSESEGRIALETEILVNSKVLHVFNAHLTHAHLKPSQEREYQMDKIIEVLPKEKVLLMGDFNTLPESNEIRKVSQILINTDPSLTPTWSVYPEGCETCMLKSVKYRLDYIFASNDIKVVSSQVRNSKASDHLPISTIIEI